jgi:hypothetical protein
MIKNVKIILATIIVLVSLIKIFANETNLTSSIEEELIGIDKEWNEANCRHDYKYYESLLAEDYIRLGPKGENLTKEIEVNFIKQDSRKEMSLIGDDYLVHLYGDSAVMTHRYTLKVGADITTGRSMHFFIKRAGKWQVIASTAASFGL